MTEQLDPATVLVTCEETGFAFLVVDAPIETSPSMAMGCYGNTIDRRLRFHCPELDLSDEALDMLKDAARVFDVATRRAVGQA